MLFLLQGENDKVKGIEEYKVEELIKRGGNKYLHNSLIIPHFKTWTYNTGLRLESMHAGNILKRLIQDGVVGIDSIVPVGDLIFVEQYLRLIEDLKGVSGSDFLKPIEVPKCLRTPEFLHRDYKIVPFQELDLDKYSFIKNASELKQYSYNGIPRDALGMLSDKVNYVQSSIIPIESEYRVLVLDHTIRGVRHYDGDCTLFPDIPLIEKMIEKLRACEKDFPKAYTIDIAVTADYTCVLEVHNFVSCGTYGFDEDCLLQMYTKGIQYELDRIKGGV